jgi:hypothetical protein
MSVVARLAIETENQTKKLFSDLESRLKTWNSASHYENLANLIELSSEVAILTEKSTDEIFKFLSKVPHSELKTEIYRLIRSRGPPKSKFNSKLA